MELEVGKYYRIKEDRRHDNPNFKTLHTFIKVDLIMGDFIIYTKIYNVGGKIWKRNYTDKYIDIKDKYEACGDFIEALE